MQIPHWYDNIYILHIRSGPYTRIANSPLLAFGHQCVWLTLLVAPLTPDYISICIHSRTSLSPPARLRVTSPSRSNVVPLISFCVFVRVDDWITILVELFSHVSYFYKCDRCRWFSRGGSFSPIWLRSKTICYAFKGGSGYLLFIDNHITGKNPNYLPHYYKT